MPGNSCGRSHGRRRRVAGRLCAAAVRGARRSFPDRPIRFFVPFPAGGSTDAVARAMQPALEKILGQPVVVENRAGAGGTLGVDAIAKATPDGYTIGLAGAGALGVNIGERMKRPYDPAKDLAPISRAAESPFILVATPTLKAKTLATSSSSPRPSPTACRSATAATARRCSSPLLMFVTMADVKINLVPYRGTAPAVTDAIAGHVQLAIADPPPSMGAISEGKLKAMAVSSKQRFSVFPDVPTFDELGLKDFEITGWFGIVAPRRRRGTSWRSSTPRWSRRSRTPRSRAASAPSAWSRRRRRPRVFPPTSKATSPRPRRSRLCWTTSRTERHGMEMRMRSNCCGWHCRHLCSCRRGRRCGCPGADLSHQADPLHRAVPGGRRHRRCGACDPAAARKSFSARPL